MRTLWANEHVNHVQWLDCRKECISLHLELHMRCNDTKDIYDVRMLTWIRSDNLNSFRKHTFAVLVRFVQLRAPKAIHNTDVLLHDSTLHNMVNSTIFDHIQTSSRLYAQIQLNVVGELLEMLESSVDLVVACVHHESLLNLKDFVVHDALHDLIVDHLHDVKNYENSIEPKKFLKKYLRCCCCYYPQSLR